MGSKALGLGVLESRTWLTVKRKKLIILENILVQTVCTSNQLVGKQAFIEEYEIKLVSIST